MRKIDGNKRRTVHTGQLHMRKNAKEMKKHFQSVTPTDEKYIVNVSGRSLITLSYRY